MTSLFDAILRHPLRCLFLLLVLTLGAAAGLPDLRIDTSIHSLISAQDSRKDVYDRYVQTMGSDRSTMILVEDEELWTPEKLMRFDDLQADLQAGDGVLKVESLLNVSDVRDIDGDVSSGALLDPVPETVEEAEDARQAALTNPLFPGQFITLDGKGLVIIVTTPPFIEKDVDDVKIHHMLMDILKPYHADFARLTVVGDPRMNSDTNDLLIAEIPPMYALLVGLLLVGTFLCLKRPQAPILPLITAILSTVITFGFTGWVGIPINILGGLMPVILLALGSTEDMHFFTTYMEGLKNERHGTATGNENRKRALRYMMKHVGLATILTSGTSALGFLASSISSIPAIQDFGYMAGFAVVANGVITLLLAPAYLSFLGDRSYRANTRPSRLLRLAGVKVSRAFDHCYRRPAICLIPFGILCAASIALLPRLEISNNALDALADTHPFMLDYRNAEDRLGGMETLTVFLDGRREDAFRTPEMLEALFTASQQIAALPHVNKVVSLADQLALINAVWTDGTLQPPKTPDQVDQFLFLLERSDIEAYVSRDFRFGALKIRHSVTNTADLLALIDKVDAIMQDSLPPWIESDTTGAAALAAYTATSLISSQLESLILMVGTVFAVMAILFASFRGGLAAVLPNVVVPLLTLGLMAAIGLPVNPPLVTVIVVSIGIAVDDTIHMLHRYQECCSRIEDPRLAARQALRSEGPAIITTTLALCIAFASQAMSDLYYNQIFGLLMAFALAMALLVDLFFTPLLITRLRFVGVFDLVKKSLPIKALKGMPLLAGMSTGSIRRLILTSVQHHVRSGNSIVEAGAMDARLFLLLTGTADVYLAPKEGEELVWISTIHSGSAIGELAMLSHQPRSATVIARDDCWLISFSEDALASRLRYQPYIASRLYRNLATILSSRLITSNQSLMDRKEQS